MGSSVSKNSILFSVVVLAGTVPIVYYRKKSCRFSSDHDDPKWWRSQTEVYRATARTLFYYYELLSRRDSWLPKEFPAACRLMKEGRDVLTHQESIALYGLYKQATVGDYTLETNTSLLSPGHQAWISNRGMSRYEAEFAYVTLNIGLRSRIYEGREDLANSIIGNTRVSQLAFLGEIDPTSDNSTGAQICALAAEGKISDLENFLRSEEQAVVDAQDISGSTALHMAADRGDVKLCELLLTLGARPNIVDHFKESALHVALKAGREECAETLLKWGADAQLTNCDGESPNDIKAGMSADIAKDRK